MEVAFSEEVVVSEAETVTYYLLNGSTNPDTATIQTGNDHVWLVFGSSVNSNADLDITGDVIHDLAGNVLSVHGVTSIPDTKARPSINSYLVTLDESVIDNSDQKDNNTIRVSSGTSNTLKPVNIKAKSKNGNFFENNLTLLDDKKGPYVEISSPDNLDYFQHTVDVKGYVYNSSIQKGIITEVKSLKWEIPGSTDGGNINFDLKGNYNFSFSTIGLPKSFILKIIAEDKNGHISEKSLTLRDNGSGPYLNIESPPEATYYKSSVKVNGIVCNSKKEQDFIDDVKSLYWEIPGISKKKNFIYFENNGTFIFSCNTTELNGIQNLEISAMDLNSNISKKVIKLLDGNIPPKVMIASPENDAKYGKAMFVSGVIIDPYKDSVEYRGFKNIHYELIPFEYYEGAESGIKGNIEIQKDGYFQFVLITGELTGRQTLQIEVLPKSGNNIKSSINLFEGESDIPSFITSPGDGNVTISWDPVPYTKRYDIIYTDDGQVPKEGMAKALVDVEAPIVIKRLKNGRLYSFKLKAVWPWETIWSHVENTIPLSKYTLEPVVKGEYKQIRISWPGISGTDKYSVFRAIDSSGDYTNVSGEISSNLYIDTDVTFGRKYYYKIRPSGFNDIDSVVHSAKILAAPPYRISEINSTDVEEIRNITLHGGYAYIASGKNGFKIIDISNYLDLKEVGFYESVDTNDVYIKDDYAYIADGTKGLKIVNVSDPKNIFLVGSRNTTNASGIYIKGNYAYIADNEGGFKIIDVSDSRYPSRLAGVDGFKAVKLDVSGNYVYIAAKSDGLIILDISDINNPKEIGSYNTRNAVDVLFKNDIVFLADVVNGLQIISVTDKKRPVKIGSFRMKNASSISLNRNFIFIAAGSNGLKVIDVSKLSAPVLFDTIKIDYAMDVECSKDHAYIAAESKIKVIQTFLFGQSYTIASCDTDGRASGVTINNKYAYIADHSGGMKIIDISDPKAVTNNSITGYSKTDYAMDIFVKDNYAFVADGYSGLKIIDVTNVFDDDTKTQPEYIGFYNNNWNVTGVFIKEKHAYLATRDNGLKILDVSNIFDKDFDTQPEFIGYYETSNARSVFIDSRYAYIGDSKDGFIIVDIINPKQPEFLSSLNIGSVSDVIIKKDYAFLAGSTGLHIVDISDPGNPILTGLFKTDYAEGIALSGDYIYLADGYRGIKVIKITNPESPILVSLCEDIYAVDIDIVNNYAFVVDSSGLKVVRIFISNNR